MRKTSINVLLLSGGRTSVTLHNHTCSQNFKKVDVLVPGSESGRQLLKTLVPLMFEWNNVSILLSRLKDNTSVQEADS